MEARERWVTVPLPASVSPLNQASVFCRPWAGLSSLRPATRLSGPSLNPDTARCSSFGTGQCLWPPCHPHNIYPAGRCRTICLPPHCTLCHGAFRGLRARILQTVTRQKGTQLSTDMHRAPQLSRNNQLPRIPGSPQSWAIPQAMPHTQAGPHTGTQIRHSQSLSGP